MFQTPRAPVILAGLLMALSPVAAIAAADVVGTATLDLEDKATGRKVAVELWFQAAPGAKVERFAPRPPLRAIEIARGAEPLPPDRRKPLVVVSHGNWGTRFSQGWLALELARAGYMVVSVSHPGTMGDDQTVAGRYRLWDRSRDVSFVLDEVLKHPKWAALVDASRIGFVGHSFGGWTGVSLAGGRYDPARQRSHCSQMAQKDFYCTGTLADDVTQLSDANGGSSFKDGRIKAFYVMATGPGQGFSVESLSAIGAPFVVDTAELDEILEPQSNSTHLARSIPGAREVVRPVGHFAYVPEGRWLVGPILARLAGLQLCDDPDGVVRGLVHRQVAQEIVAFFNGLPR